MFVLAASSLCEFPPVAGMALVTLGATATTLDRFRSTAVRLPVVIAHSVVYGGLYLLFVAVVLQNSASGRGIGPVAAVDLAASLGLIALAMNLVVGALRSACQAE
jgi:hypothetical protein